MSKSFPRRILVIWQRTRVRENTRFSCSFSAANITHVLIKKPSENPTNLRRKNFFSREQKVEKKIIKKKTETSSGIPFSIYSLVEVCCLGDLLNCIRSRSKMNMCCREEMKTHEVEKLSTAYMFFFKEKITFFFFF